MRLQVRELLGGELEKKIDGKATAVAAHLLVESPGRYPVKRGELGIEKHLLTAQDEDRLRDVLNRHDAGVLGLDHRDLPLADFSGPAERGRCRSSA